MFPLLTPPARAIGVVAAMLACTSAFAQSVRPAPPAATVRRLSADEAVRLALQYNLGIQVQRLDPQIQDLAVSQAQAAWMPQVSSSFTRDAQTDPATSFLSGGAASVESDRVSANLGVSQLLRWGGRYSVSWGGARSTTTNLFTNFSPQLNSTLTFGYTQPLLRNWGVDQAREQLALAAKTRQVADVQLEAVAALTTRNVRAAYWDLVYANDNLRAQQGSLALAQQLLRDNERRVQIGTMAPIDIVQAQAEVASNEERVIVAEAALAQAQDRLRTLVLDPKADDFWTVMFEPTDATTVDERFIDVETAVHDAIEQRTDIREARLALQQNDISLRFLRNQLLPDVSAQLNYVATGIGGVQLSSANFTALASGTSAPRSVVSDRGFGSVLGDVFQSAYPSWTVGVQIAYPLGTSAAQANLARARLQQQQAQTQLQQLSLQVAAQIRDAARTVQTNRKRVQSARVSRELQERKLEAEQRKLAAGTSQVFFVLQAQRDLALARTSELQATTDYGKSIADFDAVQRVPLAGVATAITRAGF